MKRPSAKKSLWCLLLILFTIITAVSLFFLGSYANQHKTTVEPIRFSGTYQLGEAAPPRLLTDSTYIDACENESVMFSGNFNRTLKKDTQLLFFAEYLEVHIFLEDKEIYTWGTEEAYPSFMGSGGAAWGHCVLPAAVSPDDEIIISLESIYTNNYNSAYHDFLDSLQTGDSGALARTVLTKNWPYLLTGLLLFLVGLTLQLSLLSLARQGVTIHSSVYYCALFILTASFWLVINPVYSTLIFGNAPLIMLLETISMWLFSAFLFGYFGSFMQTGAKRGNDVLLFVFVSALVVFLILQLLGLTDAYAVRDLHNILLGVSAAASLFIFRYEIHHAKNTELRTLALPGLLYAVFGLIEMLNYEFEWLQRGAALTVGFVLFTMVQFVLAVRKIRDGLLMEVKVAELERALVESRTAVMLSQIQPHFLYNALTGIKTLCGSSPEQAEDAMEHFSYFLRSNLDSLSDTRLIPFDKEISHVKKYFYLEKMRFKDRVNLVWALEFRDFMLPPLTLQPLVENAVRYGITKKENGGTVTIRSKEQDGQVLILITDDGMGFDADALQEDGRSHTGIENVRSRLKLQCGGSLTIRSEKNVGTEVQITLPERGNCRENDGGR